MPKFELEVPHSLPLPDVKSRLERAKGKLESEYGATCTWEGDKLIVARKGLSAAVNIEAARLRVDVDLSFMMAPLSGAIRNGITKQLADLMRVEG
jgi:putative polyhydroxyalkanoate system protein